MKALITGAGRGGTNLLCEFVRATKKFNFTEKVEDRTFFDRQSFPNGYATKLATENKSFTKENISRVLNENKDMVVFVAIRHPVDCCLSKIYRAITDCKKIPPDGTVDGAVQAIHHMNNIVTYLVNNFESRILILRMKDLLQKTEESCKWICFFLNIKYHPIMLLAYKNNRNPHQKKRYGDKLDDSQVDLYENLDISFDGYFSDKEELVKDLMNKIKGPG